jgi:type II secretion system protein G
MALPHRWLTVGISQHSSSRRAHRAVINPFMYSIRQNSASGFTLIELLVVISIIGLLASIIFAALGSARNQAKDARRISDLQQIQTALELYNASNGHYPSTGGSWVTACWGNPNPSQWIPGLAPTYMSSVSVDPDMVASGSGTDCYSYDTDVAGVHYKLVAGGLTSSSNLAAHKTLVDPSKNVGTAWANNAPCPGATDTSWAWAVWSDSTSMCW